jgi:hypothetical protein
MFGISPTNKRIANIAWSLTLSESTAGRKIHVTTIPLQHLGCRSVGILKEWTPVAADGKIDVGLMSHFLSLITLNLCLLMGE